MLEQNFYGCVAKDIHGWRCQIKLKISEDGVNSVNDAVNRASYKTRFKHV